MIAFILLTDVSQYHSKLCGSLFPPSSPSDIVHQYHNNMAESEILQEVLNEQTPNKKQITLAVRERFTLQDLVPSPLFFATFHFFTRWPPHCQEGPLISAHSLPVRNALLDSLVSPLLSQAIHRPVSVFVSSLSAKLTALKRCS